MGSRIITIAFVSQRADWVPGPPSEDEELSLWRWVNPFGRTRKYALRFAIRDGRMECTEFRLVAPDGPGLTSSDLRRFPIGRLIEEHRVRVASLHRQQLTNALRERRDKASEHLKAWEASRTGRPGPKGWGGEHFADVAELYHREAAVGRKPTQAVASHWQVSKSAAAKWVARAREMGLLPPAQKGKPG